MPSTLAGPFPLVEPDEYQNPWCPLLGLFLDLIYLPAKPLLR